MTPEREAAMVAAHKLGRAAARDGRGMDLASHADGELRDSYVAGYRGETKRMEVARVRD
jgi:hypothetical protein